MAEKNTAKTTEVVTEEPTLAAAGALPESNVTDAQAKTAYDDFMAGTLKPGSSIRFVTRGGVTRPVVTKLGK